MRLKVMALTPFLLPCDRHSKQCRSSACLAEAACITRVAIKISLKYSVYGRNVTPGMLEKSRLIQRPCATWELSEWAYSN